MARDFVTDTVNTIKIMLATDNHIGYLERDPVRGQDAINTFREILQLAVKHDVSQIFYAFFEVWQRRGACQARGCASDS